MTELQPWPYGKLPSASDVIYGNVRYVIQRTEDGYYGFAFRGKREIASMIGPYSFQLRCGDALRRAAPPGMFNA